MFKSFKAIAAAAALVTVAACASNDDVEEFVVVDPAASVTVEPTFNGKYN